MEKPFNIFKCINMFFSRIRSNTIYVFFGEIPLFYSKDVANEERCLLVICQEDTDKLDPLRDEVWALE